MSGLLVVRQRKPAEVEKRKKERRKFEQKNEESLDKRMPLNIQKN